MSLLSGILQGIVASLFLIGIFTWFPEPIAEAPIGFSQVAVVPKAMEPERLPVSLFFVGDIMLGRGVEGLMEKHGPDYPFSHVAQFISSPDIAVGNFEGVVAEEHVRAPSMTFQFSMKNEYLTKLKSLGFDVLSLANNHSLDYGQEDFAHTKKLCAALQILCGGHTSGIIEDTYMLREVNGEKIGFIFLSTIWNSLDEEALKVLLLRAREESTFLVAYIHWGEEYELTHNTRQEKLAQFLIDNGVDAVIGHHPHVVQDIAFYNEKPIFYSVGNFIFDQYFDENVQEGLGIGLTLTESHARYRLTVFRNDLAPSQPHTASRSDAERLFMRVLANVSDKEGVDVAHGILRIPRE